MASGKTGAVHFDLFVGSWIARDARRRGIPHLITVPALLFSFVFGPIGLLIYMITRLVRGDGISLDET